MNFLDAWQYGVPIQPDLPAPKKVIKGYTKDQVEKIAKDAADKTAAEWNQLVEMYRLQRIGCDRAARELADEGKIDMDEYRERAGRCARQAAAEAGFDFDAAQDRFYKKK